MYKFVILTEIGDDSHSGLKKTLLQTENLDTNDIGDSGVKNKKRALNAPFNLMVKLWGLYAKIELANCIRTLKREHVLLSDIPNFAIFSFEVRK